MSKDVIIFATEKIIKIIVTATEDIIKVIVTAIEPTATVPLSIQIANTYKERVETDGGGNIDFECLLTYVNSIL